MKFIIENLWLILGIGGLVLVGGTWLLFSTGMIHRMMDWLKPTGDKYIPSKVFCEDKQIRDRRLKVGRYVVSDIKKHRSFYLVHKLLMATATGKTAKFLALTERNARPIDFHNRVTAAEWSKYPSAQRVFIDTTADIRSESAKEATNNFMAQSLSIMALCACIIVVIFAIIVFIQARSGAAVS